MYSNITHTTLDISLELSAQQIPQVYQLPRSTHQRTFLSSLQWFEFPGTAIRVFTKGLVWSTTRMHLFHLHWWKTNWVLLPMIRNTQLMSLLKGRQVKRMRCASPKYHYLLSEDCFLLQRSPTFIALALASLRWNGERKEWKRWNLKYAPSVGNKCPESSLKSKAMVWDFAMISSFSGEEFSLSLISFLWLSCVNVQTTSSSSLCAQDWRNLGCDGFCYLLPAKWSANHFLLPGFFHWNTPPPKYSH